MKTKYLFASFLLALVAVVATPALAQQEASPVVEPELVNQIKERDSANMLIHMRERADLSPAFEMSWEDRGRFVYRTLVKLADESQAGVRAELDALGVDYRTFWISNAIAVKSADMATLDALSKRSDIDSLSLERVFHIPPFQPDSGMDDHEATVAAVASHLDQIDAPAAWADGYTGQGVVVGVTDSGMRYTHEALVNQYRGNTGSGFDHDFNWFSPISGGAEPNDPLGHGTHVTGSAVGDNGTTEQIGVAPDAEWIGCQACDAGGSCPGSATLACAEFHLAPHDLNGDGADPSKRPAVVNNSLGGCTSSYDPYFQGPIDAWIAAGIIPVYSNGNSSNCGYPSPPGRNTVGNPGRYGSVLGIGSSGNSNGQYAPHSNWGPTDNPNDGSNPLLPDPMGYPDLKPNVIAPGVNIRSSVPGSDTSYAGNTGTSMSAPVATGVIAVMLSAAPDLMGDFHTIGTVLMQTANPIPYDSGGGEGPGLVPNYATGWGEIDAYAAAQGAIAAAGPRGTLTGAVTDDSSGLPIKGATVTATGPEDDGADVTDASGDYSFGLAEDDYDVEFTAYGYQAVNETAVTVVEDQTTTLNVSMVAAANYEVSGTVTDNTTGWPLHARVEIDGYPNSPIYTDPADGSYSVTLPEGMDFDFTVSAMPDGYEFETRTIASLTADATEDFALDADMVACEAPGYSDAPDVLVNETFDTTSTPAGWTIVDNASSGAVWAFDDPGSRGNLTGGDGNFAIVDSDNIGSGSSQDTALVSPSFDLSTGANAVLEFKHDFNQIGSSNTASVDVSTDGGSNWTNEMTLTDDDRGPKTVEIDLADYLGQSSVQVRFVYVGSWSWWWQVDDVEVRTFGACAPTAGELLTGVVTDANDGQPINDATVAVDSTSHEATTGPNADLGDGSYYLFVPAGAQDVIASADGYSADTLSDTFVDSEARRADFALGAGQLTALPDSLSADVVFGQTADKPFIVVNDGTELADVTIIPVAGLEEDFETDFPPAGWSLEELAASECQWMRNDDYGTPNLAGGDGFAAAAEAGTCGIFAYMDVALVSPEFPVDASSDLSFILSFKTYQTDQFDVDITTDGGNSWTTLQSWTTDVSPSGPGTAQTVALGAHAGQTAQIRFRYLSDWGYHAHVDQVEITGNADWLSVSPDSGTFANGPVQLQYDTLNSTVTFDASAPSVTEPGIYSAALLVENDTPYGDITVPVEMNVLPAADQAQIEGTITSLGYCDSEPQPLAGATVKVVGQNSNYTLTTDANGYYEEWLDLAESPLAITVMATDHVSKTVSSVALSSGATTTQDIDVRLEAACPDVNPDSISAAHEPDETSSHSITLSNSGTIDLEWDTDVAPGITVSSDGAGRTATGYGSSMAGSARDVRSLFGDALPTIDGYSRINAIDCETADYLVIHDSGTIDNGYSANSANVSMVSFVEYYEPGQHPAMLGEVCVSFISLNSAPVDQSFELIVFDDNGPAGAPGAELGAVTATAEDIPGGGLPTTVPWTSVDLSGLNLTIDSGGVYIGVRFDPGAPDDTFIASDETSAAQTGFWDIGDGWEDLVSAGYDDYSALLVRPQMLPATGCINPSVVDWLSVSPATGTTPAGGSSTITVDIDTAGMVPGDYEADVCILTDEARASIISVPVSLTVDAPADYGTIEGHVESLGYCSADPQPAEGATVEVEGLSQNWTVTTDANGDFTLSIDSAESPVDISVSYADHFDGMETGVAVNAGETTTVSFSLELDAACAVASPGSLADTVGQGDSSTQVLSLANAGAGDLVWSAFSAELDTLTVAGGKAGDVGPGRSQTPANADVLSDLRSSAGQFSGSLPATAPFQGVTAIDCDTAPDLVIHDGGMVDNGYTGTAGQVNEVALVERYEPAVYPSLLGEVCLAFISVDPNATELTFEVVVYDEDGSGGTPGTELGAVTATVDTIPVEDPGQLPFAPVWHTVDLSGLEVAVQTGGVYIGIRHAPVDGIFLGADQSSSEVQTGWFQTDGGAWDELGVDAFPDYSALLIRPQMPAAAGCSNPTAVSWLDVDPASGTIVGGASEDIDVTADATGLSAGLYEAVVCIDSDDPEQPMIEVPYSLEVLGVDGIFQDRFEQ